MISTSFLLTALAALPLASAGVSFASVYNNCDQQACVYTTQPGGGPITGTYPLDKGNNKLVNFPDPGAVGSQIRVSPNCDPNNVVYLEFATGTDGNVYYDVNIQGPTQNPFTAGLSVTGSSDSCPKISCAAGGSTACFNNPNGNNQNQVKACSYENQLNLNLCEV